jgi:excisionase family DNA binding protein
VEQLTVTIKCAGAALGLGRSKIYALIAEGKLKKRKVGRRTLVTTESIRALID